MQDSCGTSGQVETPKDAKRRGGSTHAPRKAKHLELKSTAFNQQSKQT
ncbi:hypothetical protein [Fictibacillus sp. UD]